MYVVRWLFHYTGVHMLLAKADAIIKKGKFPLCVSDKVSTGLVRCPSV